MIPPRIEAKLVAEPNTGCLLWWGAVDRKGYGVVWFRGKRRRLNRVLYYLAFKRWPRKDREMLHSCDTPACSDVGGHVRPGTRRQNARDRHRKGRTRGLRQFRGSTNLRIYPLWTITIPPHERRAV